MGGQIRREGLNLDSDSDWYMTLISCLYNLHEASLELCYVGLEVVTVITVRSSVFWAVKPCSRIVHLQFRGIYCLNLCLLLVVACFFSLTNTCNAFFKNIHELLSTMWDYIPEEMTFPDALWVSLNGRRIKLFRESVHSQESHCVHLIYFNSF